MRINGKELLKKINDAGWGSNHNPKIGKTDLVKSCGYVSKREDGSERVDFVAFTDAKLAAEIEFGRPSRQTTTDPEKSTLDTSDNKVSKISLWGTGIMLCIYEISQQDYKNFQSKAEGGELDYDQLEIGMDSGDQVAPYYEPSLTINGEEINASKSLEFLGCEFSSSEEKVTGKGSFWAVCVENYKGTWGQIELPPDHEFDLSKLVVNKNIITIGDGVDAIVLEVANMTYSDDQYGELNEHSLEGKSIDWYLISNEGEVTSV